MGINPNYWIYDLESYPNIFTACFKHALTSQFMRFEISEWKNDHSKLIDFLYALKKLDCYSIGFNNIGYDYPMLHFLISNFDTFDTKIYESLYRKNEQIIQTPWEDRFTNHIQPYKMYFKQIDLSKVHHFDNKARMTSLKSLEFAMRSEDLRDLPYPPGTILNYEQSRNLIAYNNHDVNETHKFLNYSVDAIEFRKKLSKKYDRDFSNFSDVKIGKEYIISELEKASPGICYTYENGFKETRQTIRTSIKLGDVIFPYINFTHPEFIRVHNILLDKTIVNTKGAFNDVSAVIDNFKFVFGLGGIHGSVSPSIVSQCEDFVLIDWDVASYYPNIAIQNNLHPEHLSNLFCKVYNNTYQERKKHKKGTLENAALKLALNGGGFGGSGDIYCPIYDLQYMLAITVNGQLLLCMLAEYLLKIPKLKIIQINTDGVTVLCPREHQEYMTSICKWWQNFTCLQLESAEYNRMFIRDVNNYIGEFTNGKLKRKGAYGYETPLDNLHTGERTWNKNHSSLIVPMAAEAFLIRGEPIESFIKNHTNLYNFMIRGKVNKTDKLMFGDTEVQKTCRYYVSNDSLSKSLIKVSPPAKKYIVGQWRRKNKLTDEYYLSIINELQIVPALERELDATGLPWDARINTGNFSKYKIGKTNLEAGYKVTIANNIKVACNQSIDYSYYIAKTNKLIEKLL